MAANERSYNWTGWKAIHAVNSFTFQYSQTDTEYKVWGYDGPEKHSTTIWKGEVPWAVINSGYSQEQNDADKADFVTNFQSLANQIIEPLDVDGAPFQRYKASKKGWSFWAVPIEFTTSTLNGTVYAKDVNDVDIPGITCKIYNGSNAEITTAGLLNANLNTCVKTVLDFEPSFDYEMIGGVLRINSNPSQDVRLWIIGAPDIPAIYGGSKEFASGINLKFLAPDSVFEIDGRVTKYVTYNATTHQGKLRVVLKHPAGSQVNLQILIHTYRQ